MSAFDHIWTRTGGPAFPHEVKESFGKDAEVFHGMTLRDYFAAQALTALLESKYGAPGPTTSEVLAQSAYMMADAMLKSREVNNG